MKKFEIRVGGHYRASVSGKETTVRVDQIRQCSGIDRDKTMYDVTNLTTGRKTTFRSAMKFRREVKPQALGVGGLKGVKVDEVNLPQDVPQSPKLNAYPNEPQDDNFEEAAFGAEEAPATAPFGGRQPPTGTPSITDSTTQVQRRSTGGLAPATTLAFSPTAAGARPAAPPATPATTRNQSVDCPSCGELAHSDDGSYTCEDCGHEWTRESDRPFVEPSCSPPTTAPSASSSSPAPSTPLASLLQRSIASKQADTAPHLIVEARAGTGKTTTLVEGLKVVKGIPSALTPSPQQKAVWDAMALSAGKVGSVGFVAFNKSIATELQRRVPAGCDACTMHSLGFAAVRKAFGGVNVNQYRVRDILAGILRMDGREMMRQKPLVVQAVEQLVGLCKMNLIGAFLPSHDPRTTQAEIDTDVWPRMLGDLASHYEVDLNGSSREVFALVPQVLERCKDVRADNCIDYDDMIWSPVVLSLPVKTYDLLLWDEAQDGNRCQQQLALKAGKRLVLCGDPRQAIYGFAGADAESIPRMTKVLGDTERGCVTLKLTVTRRCGRAIVKEAQRIVPDFEAHETCPEGKITTAVYPIQQRGDSGSNEEVPWEKSYMAQVQPGDFILCRVNAPLVGNCFRFLKRGIKANIQGRDVGAGLISTVKKLKADTVVQLVARIDDWLHKETAKENAKRNPSDAKLISLQDRADCLVCFTEGAETVDAVVRKIESVFTDDKNAVGIKLSSCHKAKGLEAKRVFLLMPKGCGIPHPMCKSAWQIEQDMNLLYVSITRARDELVYVS